MSAESPGKGINFQGSVTSTAVVTSPFSVSQLQQISFQIRTDGTAAVSYTVQASNVPAQPADMGPPYRNDAVTSPDWGTIQSGSASTSTAGASTFITVNVCPYRTCRLVLTSTGTVVTTVYAFGTGAAS